MNVSIALTAILSTLAAVGLGVALLSLLRLRAMPMTLLLGVSYVVGVAVIGQMLQWTSSIGIQLSTSSWLIVISGIVIGIWAITREPLTGARRRAAAFAHPHSPRLSHGVVWYRDPLLVILLALLMTHLCVTVANHFARPIFAWDAFTTWMYRAKVWVLQDSVTAMSAVADWIDAGGHDGYALYANQYPVVLSVYAAFTSSLTGGWQPAAASLPWSVSLAALCLIAHGLLKLAGFNNRLAGFGAYMLGSLPLINIHAALAGYGDLWLAIYSGCGLAALLVWRVNAQEAGLWIGLIMLLLGTQIKTEGWLWFGLGVGFVTLEQIAAKEGYGKLVTGLLTLMALIWFSDATYLSLGMMGQWGINQDHIHAGTLGSYVLRIYNPARNYWTVLIEQANFLLLAALYVLAIAVMILRCWRHAASFCLMGLLITGSQLIIFSLSAFSLYAETGTAITRLLLQFTPVAVVSVVFGWSVFSRPAAGRDGHVTEQPIAQPRSAQTRKTIATSALTIVMLMAPLGIFLFNENEPKTQVYGDQMMAVVGDTENTSNGRRFVDSPINVGVLKGPNPRLAAPPRYLQVSATVPDASSASFYWVNSGESQVHSTSVPLSGASMVDLSRFDAWRTGDKKELGILVQTSRFSDTYVRSFSLMDELRADSISALLNHWTTRETLTQRTINNTLGHSEAPLSFTTWLQYGLALAAALGAVTLLPSGLQHLKPYLGNSIVCLWILAGANALATTPLLDCLPNTECLTDYDYGPHARRTSDLASEVRATTSAEQPILVIDGGDTLRTQKLPMLLLPHRAVHIGGYRQVPAGWQGAVLVVGSDAKRLKRITKNVLEKTGSRATISLESARLVLPESP